jgi:hypothetical protein
MVKDGLKNEELISEILTNGSSAIDTRNEFGVHIFEGSDLDDGVVYGRLSRPKYNISELEKSVNVKITELLPPPQRVERQTVPIEVYNAATQSIVDRDTQIVGLNGTVSNLQSEVASLQSEVQALDIEIDGVKNLQGIAQNQAQVANQRTISSISQLQFSIQKATQEAIQRASLQARNDTLLTENAQLREQLFGKTAQLQAGAKSSGKLFTVNAKPQTDKAEPPVRGSQRYVSRVGTGSGNRDIVVVNGQQFVVFNASSDAIDIEIKRTGSFGWYNISPIKFKLGSNETKTLELTTNKYWTKLEEQKTYIGQLIFEGKPEKGGDVERVELETKIKRYT